MKTRTSKVGPGSNVTHGVTLFELLIVLALISLTTLLVWPKFWGRSELPMAGRHLVGAIQESFLDAQTTRSQHRLYYDLDNGTYWLHRIRDASQNTQANRPIARHHTLPSSVRFHQVTTVHQGKVVSGQAFTQFFPIGRTDPTSIQLVDDTAGQALTLILNPLTAEVRTEDGLVD